MKRLTLLFCGLIVAASAQSNEITLQGGTTLTGAREIRLPAGLPQIQLREANGYVAGLSYTRRVAQTGAAGWHVQLPVFALQATNDILRDLGVFGGTSRVTLFATPSLLVRWRPEAVFQPFVFAGAGYGRLVELRVRSVSPPRGGVEDVGTWAVTYGGGADVRLVRWFALRGELRGFTTGDERDPLVARYERRDRVTLLLTGGVGFRF